MRHIVSILSENQNGALSRVVGLFSQRGYNIETITAGPTEDPSISRITIVTALLLLADTTVIGYRNGDVLLLRPCGFSVSPM